MTVSQFPEAETPSNTERPSLTIRRPSAARERVRKFVAENPKATVRAIMTACELKSSGHAHLLLKEVKAELCICPTCGGKGSIRQTHVGLQQGQPLEADFPQGHRRGT